MREIRARRERRERLHSFKGDDDDDNEGVKRVARRLLVANLKKQKELEKAQEQMEDGKKVKNPMEVIRRANSKGAKNTGAFASGFRLPGEEVHSDNDSDARDENTGEGEIVEGTVLIEGESKSESSPNNNRIANEDDDDEVIVLSDSEDYLKSLTQTQQNANNDWDEALDAAAESNDDNSEGSVEVPQDENNLDIHALTHLPSKTRVDVIEKARRQQRMQSRKEFMSVAANPDSYSQCQLKNFLKTANLNKKVNQLGKIVARKGEDGLEGERIASDGARRFIFTKDGDEDNEEAVENDKRNSGRSFSRDGDPSPKRKRRLVQRRATEDSDDDDIFADNAKNIGQLKDNHVLVDLFDDDSDSEDGGGFLVPIESNTHEQHKQRHLTIASSDESDVSAEGGGFMLNEDDASENEGGFMPLMASAKAVEEIEIMDDSSDDGGFVRECDMIDTPGTAALNADSLKETNNKRNDIIQIASSYESEPMSSQEKNDNIIEIQSGDDDDESEDGGNPESDRGFDVQDTSRRALESTHDSDDDIDWQDGDAERSEDGSKHDIIVIDAPQPIAKSTPAAEDQVSDDDIDWEDGDDKAQAMGNTFAVQKPFATDDDYDSDDSDVIWEGSDNIGDASKMVQVARNEPSDGTSGDEDEAQSQSSNSAIDANTAALKNAQATASHLTDWAGRAVQRAIKAHLGENNPAEDHDRVHVESDASVESDPTLQASNGDDANESLVENSKQQANSKEPARQINQPTQHAFLDTSLDALRREDALLRDEDNRRERDMDTVTDEMVEEVMQLLQLFGVPYLRAPAEAEAQCVELEKLGLVDGVVTEDSDAIVFGSNSVYRNIFDDKKYVEVYLSSDSETIGLGLNEKIALAMLLGGDYTEGVKGVGIVNGMEILKAFPVSEVGVHEGLSAFRKWLDGFDLLDDENEQNSHVLEFRRKHKTARSRWVVPKDFPSPNVLQAYSKPVVDSSKENFSWGMPDIDSMRNFCFNKMGWETSETDRAIVPVMNEMRNGLRQTRLDGYFMRSEDNIKFADVRSKRLREVWNLNNTNENKESQEEALSKDNCNSENESIIE